MQNSFPEPCSPLAKMRIPEGVTDTIGTAPNLREKYPYSILAIGYSFCVPISAIDNEGSLRTTVSVKGKFLKKKFAVIKHNSNETPLGAPCYEIARIG